MLIQKILEEIETIPEEELPQLYEIIHDFRLSILAKPKKNKRKPGLNRGSCIISDDFDEPLPDQFWLDES